MATTLAIKLSKSASLPHQHCRLSGGWRIRTSEASCACRVSTAVHSTTLPTLHARRSRRSKEGEGFEPSRPEGLPVFETGALPVQPTLRKPETSIEVADELSLMTRLLIRTNAAGGSRTHTYAVLETAASSFGLPRRPLRNALSRTRTCNNVTLDHAPLPNWAIRASHMDAGGSRTLISWLQARSLTVRRRARLSCCGKGSNLQPRPSESRALIRLSYRNKLMVQAGFEPALT